MLIEGRNQVELPLKLVWELLNDPLIVARHVPGLAYLEETEPGSDIFQAEMDLKLPAITGKFSGTVQYVAREEPRMHLKLDFNGPPGYAKGDVTLVVDQVGQNTTGVSYSADFQVGGTMARLGQRMIGPLTKQMATEFFKGLEENGEYFKGVFEGLPAGNPPKPPHPLWAFLKLLWGMIFKR